MKILQLSKQTHRQLGSGANLYSSNLELASVLGFQVEQCYHELLQPGRPASAAHKHSHKQEAILVLSGRIEATVEGQVYELLADSLIVFEVGEMHQVRNCASETASYLIFASNPSSDRVEYASKAL